MARRVTGRTTPPRRAMPLQLNPSERTLIAGKTGSGKSGYARFELQAWEKAGWPILIVDVGRRWTQDNPDGFAEEPEKSTVKRPWRIPDGKFHEGVPVQLYEPSVPAWEDSKLNAMLVHVQQRGAVVVEFDDLLNLVDEHHFPDGFMRLWTDGRKALVPIYALLQRLHGINRIVASQTERFVIFRLTDESDLKRAAHLLGDKRAEEPLRRHWYWYKHEQDDYPTLCAPLAAEVIKRGGMAVQSGH